MTDIFRNRRNFFSAVKIMIVFFAAACFAPGTLLGDTLPRSADQVFSFADHAYEQKDYNIAVAEFSRFMFFFPNDERKQEAMFKTGMAHFKQDRLGRAVAVFDRLIRQFGSTDYAIEAAFMAAEIDKRLNEDAAAYSRLSALTHEQFDRVVQDRALYRIGWLFLEQRNHASAGRAFDAISDAGKALYRTESLVRRLDDIGALPAKSPVATGVYAVMPGGGYLYTGRYQDALISFLLITAGAGAAYEGFDNDLNIIGTISAILTAGFYGGSVYGSIGAAHKYNRRVYDGFVMDLRRNRPDPAGTNPALGLKLQKNAVALTLGFSF